MSKLNSQDLSQGDVAYNRLIKSIKDGVYKPGERLRETEVGKRLSLSRTPVREALRRLEAEGIVEHRARIGAVIKTLDHAEVVELYEMRIVLEKTAAAMAAKHASAAEIDELEALNRLIEEAVENSERAASINQEFHGVIYRATRNRFLLDAARGLNSALLLLGPTTFADAARIRVVVEQHDAIIDAIRAGDAARAETAAEAHLQASMRHRLMALRS